MIGIEEVEEGLAGGLPGARTGPSLRLMFERPPKGGICDLRVDELEETGILEVIEGIKGLVGAEEANGRVKASRRR